MLNFNVIIWTMMYFLTSFLLYFADEFYMRMRIIVVLQWRQSGTYFILTPLGLN